ncbi:MAG: FG-GAP-like repeat-containing protein [Bdellovibrionota bacterium]
MATGLVTVASGGTVEVTDPGSPYFGAALIVPPGGVSSDTVFSLFAADEPIAPLHPGNEAISPTLDIEPSGFFFSLPVEVRLPVTPPILGPGMGLVSFGINRSGGAGGPLEPAPFLDNDFSDGLASVLAVHLSSFAIFGTQVDENASSVTIIQPSLDVDDGQYPVTVNGTDTIQIEVRIFGGSGGTQDLDASINLFPGFYKVTAHFENINNSLTAAFPVTGTPGPQNLSYVGGGDDYFVLSTTADLFPPSSEAGTIIVEARVHDTGYAAYTSACTTATPQCTPILNVPAFPFVAVPPPPPAPIAFSPPGGLVFPGTPFGSASGYLQFQIQNISGGNITITNPLDIVHGDTADFTVAVNNVSPPPPVLPALNAGQTATINVAFAPSINPTVNTTRTITIDVEVDNVMQAPYIITGTILPRVQILSFAAAPPTITSAQPSDLTWTALNATDCSIDNSIGSVPTNGTVTVNPVSTATYNLTCNGPFGPAAAQATVTVVQPAQILSFTATPNQVGEGGIVALEWATQDASTCTIDSAPVPVNGSLRTTISANTAFTLECAGLAGPPASQNVNALYDPVGPGTLMRGPVRINLSSPELPIVHVTQVVPADFNEDGVLDLLTIGNVPATDMHVWIGESAGGFATGLPRTLVDDSYYPFVDPITSSAAIADVNGDGIQDVVVLTRPEIFGEVPKVTVFTGNPSRDDSAVGDGTLSFFSSSDLPATPSFDLVDREMAIIGGNFSFNGDGILDVAYSASDGVRVVCGGDDGFGAWDGTFASCAFFAPDPDGNPLTQASPGSLAVGDFQGDGTSDDVAVLVSQEAPLPGSLVVLLGDGAGSFLGSTYYPLSFDVADLAVGDFDEDLDEDIAAVSTDYNGVFPSVLEVFLGIGGGVLALDSQTQLVPFSRMLSSGDFDQDGVTDLAALGSTVFIIRGNGSGGVGDGTFEGVTTNISAAVPGGGAAVGMTVGDFNADGYSDVVIGGTGDGFGGLPYLASYWGTPQPTAAPAPSIASVSVECSNTYPQQWAIVTGSNFVRGNLAATLRLDGNLVTTFDLDPPDYPQDGVNVTPTHIVLPVPIGTGPGSLSVELSNDNGADGPDAVPFGKTEIVCARGSGTFTSAQTLSMWGGTTVSGDFNADGITDIARLGPPSNPLLPAVTVALGDGVAGVGNGQFTVVTPEIPIPVVPGVPGTITLEELVAGPMDATPGDDLALLFLIIPDPTVPPDPPAPPHHLRLVVEHSNGDGTFTEGVQHAFSGPITAMDLPMVEGSFDANGTLDLAIATDFGLYILLGAGDGTFTIQGPVPGIGQINSPIVGDFVADGIPDLAMIENTFPATLIIAAGAGDGTFSAATMALPGNSYGTLGTADFNLDGILDLAVGQNLLFGTSTLEIYLGNGFPGPGDGTFTHVDALSEARVLGVADIDNDGLPDLFTTHGGVGYVPGCGVSPIGPSGFCPALHAVGPILSYSTANFEWLYSAGSGQELGRWTFGDFNEDNLIDFISQEGSQTKVFLGIPQ